ncbi:hypothetical protein BH11GEM1_BH11GEM1_36530 [soil metagenome]
MRPASSIIALTCLAAAISSCNFPTFSGGCAGVGYDAVVVAIRDLAGNPQALGATVTLLDGTYSEVHKQLDDPLSVYAAAERGGRTYDINVTKPYYNDVWVRGVKAPGGGCVTGHESSPTTITVPVQLTVGAGAPPVRSVYLLPRQVLLDRAPSRTSWAFTPIVDSNSGVSRAVSWRLVGDTASVTFDQATGTLTYRCLPKSGYLTLTARSLIDSTVTGSAAIAVQGHPAVPSDPPCG